ncbi:MAG: peptide ABC transporter substrate-binding protein [Anaerolineales bacterium]|nr:peptide ABC transporter substrate-binding protein [Anaerolineales bacterium]
MKLNLRWQILLAVVCLSLVLSLLSFQVQTANLCTQTVPASGGIFVEGVVGLPRQINPLLSDPNPVDQELVSLIFDGLTRYDATGRLVPNLAESWQVSDDGLTVQFTLRDDAHWQDGEPVTAADVAFSYGLLQDEAFPAPANVRALWQAVTIRTDGDWSVSFDLPSAYAPFLETTTRGLIPAHLFDGMSPAQVVTAAFNQAPVGTGPFMVEDASWTRTGRLHLLPNPSYWQQGIQLDALEFRFFADEEALLAAYQAGELQAINRVYPAILAELAASPDVRLFTTTQPRFTEIIFNVWPDAGSPVAEFELRAGLAYGLDRQQVIDEAMMGQAFPLDGPYLPTSWAYRSVPAPFSHQPVSATVSLNESSYNILPDGAATRQNEAGAPLQLRLLFIADSEQAAVAAAIARQWETLGVQVEPLGLARDEYHQALVDRAFDVAVVTVTPAGDPDLYDFWSQEAIIRGQNYSGWNNRRASEALETARQTWDPAVRAEEYDRFQRLFASELPALTLFQHSYTYAISAGVNEVSIGRIDSPRERYETMPQWFFLYRDVTVICPEETPG